MHPTARMYLELKGAKTAMHLLSIPFYHFLFFLYLKKISAAHFFLYVVGVQHDFETKYVAP